MKLDKDLVREILLAVEGSDHLPIVWMELNLPEYDKRTVSHHVMLLDEAGLIEARNLTTVGNYQWLPKRLTYHGHEFLDSIRDPEIWQKTKAGAAKAGTGGLGFIWELAKAYAKASIAEKTGLDLS